MNSMRLVAAACVTLVPLLALSASAAERHAPGTRRAALAPGKLGPLLTVGTSAGAIFGFDVDQHGTDGLLAYGALGDAQLDTFDQRTGKITKVVAELHSQNDYVANGIFAGDVGLADEELSGSHGITPDYQVLDPVSGGAITGSWTPPIERERVLGWAENQTTTTSLLFAIELNGGDAPDVLVSNVPANTFSRVIHLDPNAFALGAQPQLAQDWVLGDAVLATSPDFGRVGGTAPLIETIDVTTGKIRKFNGFNNGPFGAGFVNGLAVDSNTHVACTTTELNSNVEFYDLKNETGITVSLPNTTPGDQINSGWSVAADPLHKLFLVTQPFDSVTGNGSAIYAYDETGHLVEQIHGFSFSFPSLALHPAQRSGYVSGPALNQLQEFSY